MDFDIIEKDTPVKKIADAFAAVGLGSVPARIIFGFILGSGVGLLLRPGFSFDTEGSRPFKLSNMNDPRGTWLPWYAFGVIIAVILGVFW